MGVALVDIQWEKYNDNNTTYGLKWENCPDEMITTENQQVCVAFLPIILIKCFFCVIFIRIQENDPVI